ncbi:MAG: hypothetical protein K2X39_08355, partial [Silvanigrellaceae bacterium]|nr:hypothetical protein [Silvanigrellaceae bacterium]
MKLKALSAISLKIGTAETLGEINTLRKELSKLKASISKKSIQEAPQPNLIDNDNDLLSNFFNDDVTLGEEDEEIIINEKNIIVDQKEVIFNQNYSATEAKLLQKESEIKKKMALRLDELEKLKLTLKNLNIRIEDAEKVEHPSAALTEILADAQIHALKCDSFIKDYEQQANIFLDHERTKNIAILLIANAKSFIGNLKNPSYQLDIQKKHIISETLPRYKDQFKAVIHSFDKDHNDELILTAKQDLAIQTLLATTNALDSLVNNENISPKEFTKKAYELTKKFTSIIQETNSDLLQQKAQNNLERLKNKYQYVSYTAKIARLNIEDDKYTAEQKIIIETLQKHVERMDDAILHYQDSPNYKRLATN